MRTENDGIEQTGTENQQVLICSLLIVIGSGICLLYQVYLLLHSPLRRESKKCVRTAAVPDGCRSADRWDTPFVLQNELITNGSKTKWLKTTVVWLWLHAAPVPFSVFSTLLLLAPSCWGATSLRAVAEVAATSADAVLDTVTSSSESAMTITSWSAISLSVTDDESTQNTRKCSQQTYRIFPTLSTFILKRVLKAGPFTLFEFDVECVDACERHKEWMFFFLWFCRVLYVGCITAPYMYMYI